MFLTACYLIADTATGAIRAAAAGHPPFLWITGGDVRVVSVPSGPPLGILAQEYPSSSLELNRGDRLLLLTDGVFDAKNRDGARLGFETLVRFVKAHASKDQLTGMIVDFIADFSGGAERADDLTLVEVRRGEQ
jgi:sigma-B regulation protein RsbU (phosphoserine phosphatase)